MIPGLKPGAMKASGLSIDCLMKAASFPARTLSSTGPTWPVVPASASVWQVPQAVAPVDALPATNSCLASTFGAGAPGAGCCAGAVILRTHAAKAGPDRTCAVWRM